MKIEIREMMIYNSPPELGALWTDVNEMMKEMGGQQKILLTKKMRAEEVQAKRRAARMKALRDEAWVGVGLLFSIFLFAGVMAVVIQDRTKKYPELGTGIIPKVSDDYKAIREEHRKLRMLEFIEQHKDELDN
jgi:hypothetical protein